MKILFLGGDRRYLPIIEDLNQNNDVDLIGYNSVNIKANKLNENEIDLKKYDVIILPMNGINDKMVVKSLDGDIVIKEECIKDINSNCVIITGLITKVISGMKCKQIINLLDDKDIKEFNTDVTVEGILQIINVEENKKINKICILGYGNIGKKLYDKLKKTYINSEITVGEIKKEKINAKLSIFDTSNEGEFISQISNPDIIINTVPKNIINDNIASNIAKKAIIIDVASYPHGICNEIIQKYKLNYNLYLGIPGKYNPEKSGIMLLKKIKSILKERLI